ncbi:U1 small nuclear ribonucleoprotein C isoform X1 [Sarcophilus harrisii]|uniref:U1 small nuclear ribonucleoprotein C isoform X1 n=1 Tax=Sarcophilus harrisii TaxID=9305 RepID=UPI001301F3BB|nr:U1 small nuclear ribonucleoprotein C isoform X1 [Sarcophilus harrisii]
MEEASEAGGRRGDAALEHHFRRYLDVTSGGSARIGTINGPRSTMPKFYCDYCDTYLTHDSPSVRKTHCSGRKHKENVKDYYQKWMEEQAQSLIDKTTAAFQQGKIPPTPFSAPPPGGAMIPPPPSLRLEVHILYMLTPLTPGWMLSFSGTASTWYDASTTYGRAPYDAYDGAPSSWNDACGTCSWDEASHGRPYAYDAWTPNDETSCSAYDGAYSTGNDPPRQIRIKGNPFMSFFIPCSTPPKHHGAAPLGCFPTAWQGRLALTSVKEETV